MNLSAKPTKQCVQRLQKELRTLLKESNSYFVAAPDPQNILVWCVRIVGPPNTCYAGGYYICEIRFPSDYPFRPPTIKMCTPNGRFKTDAPICLSNSSFHPEEWSPMWGVSTIITGMISFFASEESAMGTMKASDAERRRCARESRAYNVKRLAPFFKRSLPEVYAEDLKFLEEEENHRKCERDDENFSNHASLEGKRLKLCKTSIFYTLGGKLGLALNNAQGLQSGIASGSGSEDRRIKSLPPSSNQVSSDRSNHLSACTALLSFPVLVAMALLVALVGGLFYCLHCL